MMESSEEYELPAVEAVLAGTLALMTGYAQARCAVQRRAMVARIASNLALLGNRRHLSTQFRCAVSRLRSHWELMLEAAGEAHGPERLRHVAPATPQ